MANENHIANDGKKVRLIDANALVDALIRLTFSGWGKDVPYLNQWWHMAVKIKDNFIKAINNAPTVDAVEVVHGRWEWIPTDECISVLTCSVCKNTEGASIFNNYCPNCGAKMDGGGNA